MGRWHLIRLFLPVWIGVVCCSAALGQSPQAEKNLVRQRPSDQKWALLIGVDDYSEAVDLKYCGQDVRGLRQRLLGAGFLENRIILAARQKAQFAGWTTGGGGQYKQEEFIIAPADSTVAAGQGFGQQLGMITAVFYTFGLEGLPEPPPPAQFADDNTLGQARPGAFGTGAGRQTVLRLEEQSGPERGIILAAMTVHYAPSAQINLLKQASDQ
jgi:hypothetical protein